jgi:uncharacterized protein YecE (DUF72 family)
VTQRLLKALPKVTARNDPQKTVNPAAARKIKIGTCGWSYDDWSGAFYPERFPAGRRLGFYGRHFNSVEIDSTFYNVPSSHVVGQWLDAVPDDFVFSAKLSREITHERKLRHCEGPLAEFLASLAPLRRKLGCVIVQLPPYFTPRHDEQALRDFVLGLPDDFRFAIEFRDPAWNVPRIVHLLEEHRVCWVWNDVTPIEKAEEGAFDFLPRTTDFLYLRLLGDFEASNPEDSLPASPSTRLLSPRDGSLESWALKVEQCLDETHTVQICASNQFEGFAPSTARRIAGHLGLGPGLATEVKAENRSGDDSGQLDLL